MKNYLSINDIDSLSTWVKEAISLKKQPRKFTDSLKTLILKSAHGIAASFANKNKSELIFLGKLSINLKS